MSEVDITLIHGVVRAQTLRATVRIGGSTTTTGSVMVELSPSQTGLTAIPVGTTYYDLTLANSVAQGKIKTILFTIVAKGTVDVTSWDFELFDVDISPNPVPHGRNTIYRETLIAPKIAVGLGEDPIVNRAFVAERVFSTKGTTGVLGLAITRVGGSGGNFDAVVEINGEALA